MVAVSVKLNIFITNYVIFVTHYILIKTHVENKMLKMKQN